MLLKQLRALATVAEQKSFTEAAWELGVSQSAVSQQIRALEKDLGIALVLRGNRAFTLTEAGEYLAREGRRLADDAEAVRNEAVRLAGSRNRLLRFACLASCRGPELHRAVSAFSAAHPEIDFDLASGSHEEIYGMLKSGRADLAVSDQRRRFSDEFENLVLAEPRVWIELPAASPLARIRKPLESEDLARLTCILVAPVPQREAERGFYADLLGFRGSFLFADSFEAARLLVSANRGFLPADGPGSEAASETIRALPLRKDGRPVLRRICAFWQKKNASALIEAFAKELLAQFGAAAAR